MNSLDFIQNKFKLDFNQKSPIEIPDFGREQLADLFAELGFKTGVEVGVERGRYSEILMKANPQLTLYGVDPYVAYKGYTDFVRQTTIDKNKQEAHDRLKFENYHFVEKFSIPASEDFEDESLDFVYLDGNHDFQNVVNDLAVWSKKVKKGGIISGHDWYKHRGPTHIHVYQAVNGFTDSWKIRPWFIAGSKAVLDGQVRDKSRSFFWCKS